MDLYGPSATPVTRCLSAFGCWTWLSVIFILHWTPALAQSTGTPPTSFIKQPEAGSVQLRGNSKVLLCYATSVPPPVYRWTHNGQFLSSDNITDTVHRIENIQRDDVGDYQCVASNDHGAILSDKAFVHVSYMVPFSNSGNQEKTVDQGQARIIDLPPLDCYPEPSVRWFQGFGRPVSAESQRTHVTLQNQLVILETRLQDDNSLYKATAVNSQSGHTSDTQTFVLKVQSVGSLTSDVPPSIVIPPTATSAVEGDVAIKLECVANARPLNYLSLNWYKLSENESRQQIVHDNSKYMLSMYRRVLTVKDPVLRDAGTYMCEAVFARPGSTSVLSVSAQANLTIQVEPHFSAQYASEIRQDVGTSVVIPCQAVGNPTPTITWYRNALPLQSLQNTRYSVLESGNLQIDNAVSADSAVYQCFAENEAGSIYSSVWVRVLSSPPVFVESPVNVSVVAGDLVRLPCEVTGAPVPNVSWTRVTSGGVTEDLPDAGGRIEVLDDALLIPASEVSDTGIYTCSASNTQGSISASAHVTVTLRTRIIAPPQDASVIKGTTTKIMCSVSHDPSVTVTWVWSQGNAVIPPTDTRRQVLADGSLEIRAIRNDDIGTYTCYVVSSGGNDTASCDIKVIELPYSPQITSVGLNEDSPRAVDVSWSPGFDGNSAIRRFIVQYRRKPPGVSLLPGEGWIVADDQVGAAVRQYTVSGLLPARSYQFRVSAVNDVGEGDASDASNTVVMPQQAPEGPPRGVVGSPRSNSSIIIQWQPPDEDKWNGDLLGYTIRYRLTGYQGEPEHENVTNIRDLSYELQHLIIFQEYDIAVAAFNSKGLGVFSDYIHVRTLEGQPTAPPTDLQATPANSTSIKLTWMPPFPQKINGINQGYKISAVNVATGLETVVVFPSDTSNMLGLQTTYLLDLSKYTEYSISVLCFTSRGDGPSTLPVAARTLEDVPDRVEDLRFDSILDTTLRVLWAPPINSNGRLTGYTLSYKKKNETSSMRTVNLTADTLHYTITGLTATTAYTIQVYARTAVGAGPPNTADIESGIPPVKPEAPRNLAITNIQDRSVLLQFIPGFSGHTSISLWIIEAQLNHITSAGWVVIQETVSPDATALAVSGLSPYTPYRLRMKAQNVANISEPSEPTRWFETMQAAPERPPQDVSLRAINETAIRVRWTPLLLMEWNGEQRGYEVLYEPADAAAAHGSLVIRDDQANGITLTGLEEWMTYSVKMAAFNQVGYSSYSNEVSETTRESVPSEGPANVSAVSVNSTTIEVRWGKVPFLHQNGFIRGYKISYESTVDNIAEAEITVDSNETFTAYLTGLRKYVWYSIQVAAYTRIGSGAFSQPPYGVRTLQDVPGPPSGVFFPDVTQSSARVLWQPPREPNGIILGYRVQYGERADEGADQIYTVEDDTLGPNRRHFDAYNLDMNKYYVFAVTASTELGWGIPAVLEVYIIINRRVPDAPSKPHFGSSQIGDRWVTVSWTPGNDGYGPVRNYTMEVQPSGENFVAIPDYIPHDALQYNITGLQPYTRYKFRIAASNDIGLSPFSESSDEARTKQAPPKMPPENVRASPLSKSSVHVEWQIPPEDSWNGQDLRGYIIAYREVNSGLDWRSVTLYNGGLDSSHTVANLVLFKTYEFKIRAFNSLGESGWSSVIVVYLEVVPKDAPVDMTAVALSSTEIRLTWQPPEDESINGELLGYKVYFWQSGLSESTTKMLLVPAADTSCVLSDLEIYTEYAAIMLAYNTAGDGPNTTAPAVARTAEGVPSPPGRLHFVVVDLNAVNVSWQHPTDVNGVLELYEISYYMDDLVDGESKSVQVKLSGERRSYVAQELTEKVKYVFGVKARTSVNWGNESVGNITVQPQPGSPDRPTKPQVELDKTALTIIWDNGHPGVSPITSYIIQAQETADPVWATQMVVQDPAPQVSISYHNLKPQTSYQFRVLARNDDRGISVPSEPSDVIQIKGEEGEKPFYQQWWFLVIVALTGVILIISVVSALCLTGRGSAAKHKDPTIPRTTIQLTDTGMVTRDDGGFASYDSRRSQRSQRSHRSTRSQRSQRPPKVVRPKNNIPTVAGAAAPMPVYANARIPPRPSPGSVNYSDDENKGYPDEESDLSEKPSDISSSDNASQESESDMEDQKPPPGFMNRYVNGDVQQSWRRHQSASSQPANVYGYSDSDHDSSQYGVALNGGHVIMNNRAGSRAPLPGFSSFV